MAENDLHEALVGIIKAKMTLEKAALVSTDEAERATFMTVAVMLGGLVGPVERITLEKYEWQTHKASQ